jgi:lysyl endopeptidase
VSCDPNWQVSAAATAVYTLIDQGAVRQCTGTILNSRNNSRIPYFLTAGHCVNTEEQARTVSARIVYQRACPADPEPQIGGYIVGATLLETRGLKDGNFSFLRLAGVPNDPVRYADWDTANLEDGTSVVSIYFPLDDFKKIGYVTSPFSGGIGSLSTLSILARRAAVSPVHLHFLQPMLPVAAK